MVGRRIVYGAALLAALAFQIFYDGVSVILSIVEFIIVLLFAKIDYCKL